MSIFTGKVLMSQQLVFDNEKTWLEQLLLFRFGEVLSLSNAATSYDFLAPESRRKLGKNISSIAAPVLQGDECHYARFIVSENLDFAERLLLALVFLPHVYPELLLKKNEMNLRAEFGFSPGTARGALIPTGQTYIYLFAGTDTERKLQAMELLCGDSVLFEKKLLLAADPPPGEPLFSGKLVMSNAWARLFILDMQPVQAYFSDPLTPDNI